MFACNSLATHLITWKHEHKMMLISSGGSLNVFCPPHTQSERQQIYIFLSVWSAAGGSSCHGTHNSPSRQNAGKAIAARWSFSAHSWLVRRRIKFNSRPPTGVAKMPGRAGGRHSHRSNYVSARHSGVQPTLTARRQGRTH